MPAIDFSVSLMILFAIAVIYALFDVFNNRNVPNLFAYVCIAIGVAVAVLSNPVGVIEFSLAVAALIGAAGYLVYKAGFWGAGDVFELVTISLLLPLQPAPIFVAANQLGLPFVVSVFVAMGLSAIWIVPIYYLLIDGKGGLKSVPIGRRRLYSGALMALTYTVLILVILQLYGFSLLRVAILLLIAIPSVSAMFFEDRITAAMVRMVPAHELEEDDMLALNMMSREDVARLTKKHKGFGRLVSKKFMAEARSEDERLPVYRNAPPLALFILIGVIISLLFGNIILLML